MAQFINKDEFTKAIQHVIQADIDTVLEECLAKHKEEINRRLRKILAQHALALLQFDYNLEYLRGELRISVKVPEKEIKDR
jgi:hypothetical protein